jgi:hypothetical protein
VQCFLLRVEEVIDMAQSHVPGPLAGTMNHLEAATSPCRTHRARPLQAMMVVAFWLRVKTGLLKALPCWWAEWYGAQGLARRPLVWCCLWAAEPSPLRDRQSTPLSLRSAV